MLYRDTKPLNERDVPHAVAIHNTADWQCPETPKLKKILISPLIPGKPKNLRSFTPTVNRKNQNLSKFSTLADPAFTLSP